MSNKGKQGQSSFQWNRFVAIVRKEFLQIRRDPASLAIALAMPLLMLLLFGYAVNTDVDHLSMGVWDQAKTAQSRELVQNLTNTGYFDERYQVEGYGELQGLMDSGQIKVGLVIPRDYSKALDTWQPVDVQVLVDGTDPNAARTALANAQLILQNRAMEEQQAQLSAEGLGNVQIPIQVQARVLYNPNMKSLLFNIPALIGLIMQNVTAILTAFTIVRERERGTMEQLIVTPVRPSELIVGKLTPYVLIGMFSFVLVLAAGTAWFGVPVKGSVGLLLILSLLFLVTALAIGILISTVAKTQLQAMQMAFAFILPSVLLSGFIFPRETMPLVIQWIGAVIPLTYFLEILRGIFLKGIGIGQLWQDTVSLAIFAVLFCTVAVLRFRKRLD
ncbi:ABC transporter permease [Kyrpidia tusciae]|uniref:Transport permease protein n=1 Tax=Kyrpidia tusciae (strain DSM 2912 / NBRC 15312 / T2) TaxID=562970 RepID=D5WUD4_KYRT2|nr:ABC transporter permease [Kyrpidia tusciae]ADG07386.1 ABC-2 type transporter [Kyrpidia tusciae DSM 2912]